MTETKKVYNKEVDPLVTADYNWKIALTDLISQARYLQSQGYDVNVEENQVQALKAAMKYLGFDTDLPYLVTKEAYKYRNLENKVVDTHLVYGFAEQAYLDLHGIKTVEYMLVKETDKYLRNELEGLHKTTKTTNRDLRHNYLKGVTLEEWSEDD